jgi:branched-chain amino acid transport system permease protein
VPITAGFSYAAYRFVVIGVCLCVALALILWIERTKMGAIIRAAAERPEMVDVLGIDASRVHLTVFAVGTALAMTAGALAAPLTSVYPNMGDSLLIISFVVVVIGGLGSISGAFWSALLIGLIDTFGKAYGANFATSGLGSVFAALASMSVYLLMIIVLLFRPSGLFGGRA